MLSASRVTIVAGKGGVGKTTVTAVLARAAADAGLRVLAVELDGKPVLADLVGGLPCERDRGVGGARGVPARARLRSGRQAAVGVRRDRRRGHGRAGHRRHRRAGQDQAARAQRRVGRHRRRRPGRRARHHVPDVGRRAARGRARRPGAGPGRRGAGAAPRPDPLPGRARHAARDDAGQRGRPDGVRAGGPRRGPARAGHRQQRRPRRRTAPTLPDAAAVDLARPARGRPAPAGGGVPAVPAGDAGRRDRPARPRAGARAVAPPPAARGRDGPGRHRRPGRGDPPGRRRGTRRDRPDHARARPRRRRGRRVLRVGRGRQDDDGGGDRDGGGPRSGAAPSS